MKKEKQFLRLIINNDKKNIINEKNKNKIKINDKNLWKRIIDRYELKELNIKKSKEVIRKLSLAYIKYFIYSVNTNDKKEANIEKNISLFFYILNNYLVHLTPKDIINLFPPKKEYDGDKYQKIDYFSTMEHVSKFSNVFYTPFSSAQQVLFFLSEYYNPDIFKFNVMIFILISDYNILKNNNDDFFSLLNQAKIIPDDLYNNNNFCISIEEKQFSKKGQTFIINKNTGEILGKKAKKRIPNWMRKINKSSKK